MYTFHRDTFFKDISLQINDGDKIGLVGKNGAGKSTMLKLISGQSQPSEGKMHKPKDCTIGYLTQDIKIDTTQTVFDYLLNSNGLLKTLNARIEEINLLWLNVQIMSPILIWLCLMN